MITTKEKLLNNTILLKKEAMKIAEEACASTQKFDELMTCFLSNEYRVAQRAAWCVSNAVTIDQQLIVPYIKTLIDQLLRTDVHPAVVRNSTRILNRIAIPEEYHGEVMNACFILAEKAETPIASKAFALAMLYKMYWMYPDIKPELETIAQACLNNESAAVTNVLGKIISGLHKTKAPGVHHKSTKIK